jgi:molybdopterin/thiamine biosynthesis adenylyltransferase
VCLVLGTGGIGQNAALTLVRMGVRELVLMDMDKYEASNLTRQCLGTPRDVGRQKVECAAQNIQVGEWMEAVARELTLWASRCDVGTDAQLAHAGDRRGLRYAAGLAACRGRGEALQRGVQLLRRRAGV